jgi:hypothetical protein
MVWVCAVGFYFWVWVKRRRTSSSWFLQMNRMVQKMHNERAWIGLNIMGKIGTFTINAWSAHGWIEFAILSLNASFITWWICMLQFCIDCIGYWIPSSDSFFSFHTTWRLIQSVSSVFAVICQKYQLWKVPCM